MADDAFPIGEFDKLLSTLREEIDSKTLSAYIVALLKKWLDEGRAESLAKVQSGTLTCADWPLIRSKYRALVRAFTQTREPIELEWLLFVDQMTQRQGTRMPDWSAFYAERGELERKIQERGDS